MEPAVNDLDLTAIDLVVDDRDPQAIFDASLAKFLELAPTARPRNGSVEAILLEAIATATADGIYAANRVISLVVEAILGLYDVARFDGTSAAGVVTLTLDGTRTLTVTEGQRLLDPGTGLVLLVTADTSGVSVSTLAIPVQTEEPGGAGNSITSGTAVDLLDSIPYAVSASVTTTLSGGADAESDTAYIDRATARLARVTSSLVLPGHFAAYCLEDTRILRATAIDNYQPGGTPGSDIGHITVLLYGSQAPIATDIQTELETAMSAISSSMLTVHVEPATVVTQAVTLTVEKLAGFTDQEVEDNVTAALQAFLNTDTWDWGGDVIVSEIIVAAAAAAGVDFVDTVTTPAGTVTVDADELVTAGTITVTVNP